MRFHNLISKKKLARRGEGVVGGGGEGKGDGLVSGVLWAAVFFMLIG